MTNWPAGFGLVEALEALHELAFADGEGLVGLAFLEFLADAEDAVEAGVDDGVEFFVAQGVGFADDMAAFGVADEDVLDAQVEEHGGGNFAGEGAVFFKIGVLGAQADGGAFGGGDGVKVDKGGNHGDFRRTRIGRTLAARPVARATAWAFERFIFQLPATKGLRIVVLFHSRDREKRGHYPRKEREKKKGLANCPRVLWV